MAIFIFNICSHTFSPVNFQSFGTDFICISSNILELRIETPHK